MKNVSAKLPLSITVPTTRRKEALNSPSAASVASGLPVAPVAVLSSPSAPVVTPPSPSSAGVSGVLMASASMGSNVSLVNNLHHHHHQHSSNIVIPSSSGEKTEKNTELGKHLVFKIAILSMLWFLFSLLTMYLNKYALATLDVSLVLLSTSQLVSTVCYGGLTVFIFKSYHSSSSPSSSSSSGSSSASTTSSTSLPLPSSSSSPFLFTSMYKEFILLGVFRTLTVVLGLASYKYVAASFTETIKATSPLFTVIFAWWILKERIGVAVALSLLPILVGLFLCSIGNIKPLSV
eukprot:TRINITY_DN5491_c0_g1_i3.p1 TRINITY_DN5491_c0_g1~~TRINITY_DN5491_c0_g1_i3.p1  ORF type:complete len:292 (-),score=49.80 TRINITY_DN5491_c0_g1_i3:771-1646(-)